MIAAALAHHGGGTFDNTRTIELTGTLTRLELINPHSWIYFSAKGPDGTVRAYRCEMRSAIQMADLPYHPDKCKEQAFVDYSKAAPNRK